MSLRNECGVTQISTAHGKSCKKRHGAVVQVSLIYDATGPEWYKTYATYADGHVHTFTGFGWGYGGEGPRGLADWCVENGVPLTMGQVAALPNEHQGKYLVWEWKR